MIIKTLVYLYNFIDNTTSWVLCLSIFSLYLCIHSPLFCLFRNSCYDLHLSLSIYLSLSLVISLSSLLYLLYLCYPLPLIEHFSNILGSSRAVPTCIEPPSYCSFEMSPQKRVPRVEYSSELCPTGCTHCPVKYPIVHTVSLNSYISLLVSLNLEPYEPVVHFQMSKGGPPW